MTTITLTNNFHNTSANVQLVQADNGLYRISRATARRLRNKLCGSTDCTCGDTFGARGGVQMQIVAPRSDYYLVELA